ncbi:MAG: prepilin-type N-terminal cleavage/methylation domain-containing protein [Bacilli bacterium]|nr:prepilin-type N-terminal cleavage/methylation domain-containing protein [Bacilli bacterium]
MNYKRGFTLIELLAVIVILAIIMLITVPIITNMVSDIKIRAYIQNEQAVIKATKLYLSKNSDYLPIEIGDTAEVSVVDLKNSDYLKELKDPNNSSKECGGYILVTKTQNNNYDYIPHIKCDDNINSSSEDGLIGHYKLNESEEGTTNLWTGNLGIYNNYSIPATLVATGGFYKGAPIYRLTMTPTNATQVSSIRSNLANHGVMGSRMTFLGNNKYTTSIYWKPVNKTDVQVGGRASNISGWYDGNHEVLADGWTRCVTYRNGTVIDDKTDYIFWSFRSPSFELGDTMVIDWVAPQIEQKGYATDYTPTSRDTVALDYTLNKKNGVINGAKYSKNDNAYLFNGVDDFASIPLSKPTDEFTVAVWAKRKGDYASGISFASIVGWRYVTESIGGIAYNSNYDIGYKDYGGSIGYINTGFKMMLDKWYHIVATYKANEVNLYIDGELVKSIAQTPTIYNSNEFQIGATKYCEGQNRAFNGNAKDVRIYNRALSAIEIRRIYETTR